jgi:cobalt/nickel transport system permease protein
MTLAFDAPTGAAGWFRRLDPRWKLAALVSATAASATVRSPAVAAVFLLFALAVGASAGLPGRPLSRRLGALALALAPLLILLPVTIDPTGPAVWEWGWLRVSERGCELAGVLALRAVAIMALALTLLAGSPVADLARAARCLFVPGLIVQLFLLSHRYTFVLADEFVRLRTALRVRGFRNRADRHSYRTIGHVAGTLLVRGSDRAERVAHAMRCRGFDGHFRTLTAFRTRPADVLFFLTVVPASLALLAWDLAARGVVRVG